MLYDILIIDDDFSGKTVLDEMTSNARQGNRASWNETIMSLYFDLTKENLRVIWSTGEIRNLNELKKYQLSTVKYIICDLHLSNINSKTTNKNIVSKITEILKKLDKNFGEKSISFWVNSRYIEKHPNIQNDLEKALKGVDKNYPAKYVMQIFAEKNVLTDEQEKELLDTSLLSHIKEQVIKKHLEVERHFNEKINVECVDLKDALLRALGFSSKHKIVKKFFDLEGHNKRIDRFNEARNYIAHNEINSLSDLKGIKDIDCDNFITFEHFSDLINYLKKADELITIIKNAPKK